MCGQEQFLNCLSEIDPPVEYLHSLSLFFAFSLLFLFLPFFGYFLGPMASITVTDPETAFAKYELSRNR